MGLYTYPGQILLVPLLWTIVHLTNIIGSGTVWVKTYQIDVDMLNFAAQHLLCKCACPQVSLHSCLLMYHCHTVTRVFQTAANGQKKQ